MTVLPLYIVEPIFEDTSYRQLSLFNLLCLFILLIYWFITTVGFCVDFAKRWDVLRQNGWLARLVCFIFPLASLVLVVLTEYFKSDYYFTIGNKYSPYHAVLLLFVLVYSIVWRAARRRAKRLAAQQTQPVLQE